MWKLQWSLWKGVGVHWPGCLKNFLLFPFILNILLADIRASAVFFWKSFDIFLKCKFRRQCAHLSGMQTNQCNHHHTFPVWRLWSKSSWKFISSLTYYLHSSVRSPSRYSVPLEIQQCLILNFLIDWFWIFTLIDFHIDWFSHWFFCCCCCCCCWWWQQWWWKRDGRIGAATAFESNHSQMNLNPKANTISFCTDDDDKKNW